MLETLMNRGSGMSAYCKRSMITVLALLTLASGARAAAPEEITIQPIAGNVYLATVDGINSVFAVAGNQVVLVDAQTELRAGALITAIEGSTGKSIRTVINTDAQSDRVGGNAVLAKRGAAIIAHENTRKRMAEGMRARVFRDRLALKVPNEEIELLAAGAAHTDGDTFVFFRTSNVLYLGDVLLTESFPVIDASSGGSVTGLITALNKALDLTVTAPGFLSGRGNTRGGFPPPEGQESRTDTIVVSGKGRLYDQADLLQYRDMVVIIRDRIADLVGQGKSLEEVKAARPTLGWDTRYGAGAPPHTTDHFVETIFNELSRR